MVKLVGVRERERKEVETRSGRKFGGSQTSTFRRFYIAGVWGGIRGFLADELSTEIMSCADSSR